MTIRTWCLGAALFAVLPSAAQAETAVFVLPDIGTYTDYTADTSLTFTGDGFSGMYQFAWGHLFGLEGSTGSKALAQVGIGALAGTTINSATVSFMLLDGINPISANVGGFGGDGTLSFVFNPATPYGTASAPVTIGANSIDVTAIVAAAVAADEAYLNLVFSGVTSQSVFTYTYAGFGYSPDRAMLRLTVDYAAAVPEPASWAMMIGGFGLAGGALRRRRVALRLA